MSTNTVLVKIDSGRFRADSDSSSKDVWASIPCQRRETLIKSLCGTHKTYYSFARSCHSIDVLLCCYLQVTTCNILHCSTTMASTLLLLQDRTSTVPSTYCMDGIRAPHIRGYCSKSNHISHFSTYYTMQPTFLMFGTT
jgi:hypothetical protein